MNSFRALDERFTSSSDSLHATQLNFRVQGNAHFEGLYGPPDITASQPNDPVHALVLMENGAATGHSPKVVSTQSKTALLLSSSTTLGSIAANRSRGSTAVAATMSQRSLNTTDMALYSCRVLTVRA